MSGNVLTIIIGRAGSKGVPGKNMRDVAGRPCAAWTIDFAMRSECATGITVSTDCGDLTTLALEMGAEVKHRDDELASDSARVDDVLRDAAQWYDPNGRYESVALLYANVPVRPMDLLDRAAARLIETGADSVQSYAQVGKHHPWWTCVVGDDGDVRPWEGDTLFHNTFRRQDLPPAHVPDGGVTVVRRAALFGACDGPHDFLGTKRAGVVTGEGEVIDIDAEIDLVIADAVLRGRIGADA